MGENCRIKNSTREEEGSVRSPSLLAYLVVDRKEAGILGILFSVGLITSSGACE